MPKKSGKSKSKRTGLKDKYKIIRKVKAHHKKLRRDEKKNGPKKIPEKDPGIPKDWPYKQALIEELETRRMAHDAEIEKKKQEKKERQIRNKEERKSNGGMTILELQAEAALKEQTFMSKKRARLADEGRVGDNDNSRRAYYKEFVKVVEASDVIIQVLDVRDPMGCRCLDVERFVRQLNPNKKIVLLLNKIDLVPKDNTETWLKYFREELPTVAFKCSTQQQRTKLSSGSGKKSGKTRNGKYGYDAASKSKAPSIAPSIPMGGECLGADTLIQLLKNYARNLNIKTAITVGIVGFPNVGKSSLINSLKRAKVANVGGTAGVTKVAQEVHLDKMVKLLDSPGVVFASTAADGTGGSVALRNAVRVEKLADPVAPVGEILERCDKVTLMALYKIPRFKGASEFLQKVAAVRGRVKKGGVPDVEAAARLVLSDWNGGNIKYCSTPPVRNKGSAEYKEAATLVAQWGKEFDADEVFANEENAVIAGLPEEDAAEDFVVMKSEGTTAVDLAAMEGAESEDEEESEEEGSDMDDEDGPPTLVEAGGDKGKGSLRQNKMLYAEEGQYNPKSARAGRKRAKLAPGEEIPGYDDDEEYDYNEHFHNSGGGSFAALAEEGEGEDGDEDEDEDGEEMSGDEEEGEEGEEGEEEGEVGEMSD